MQRHQAGDWGDLGEEDWKENDTAVHAGLRLLSSYRSTGGVTFWIITEADRSVTTLLLPDDIDRTTQATPPGRLFYFAGFGKSARLPPMPAPLRCILGLQGSSQNKHQQKGKT